MDIEYWYKDMVGQTFEVRWETDYYYFVSNNMGANFVNKLDVHIKICQE